MSIYSNVTEQDLINLRKLAEQQESQRALKIKNRILKQTRDIKLSESLSPITKKLDEVKETTQKTGDVSKESSTPQLAIENTPNHQPIENIEGVIYDVELDNTLNIIKDNTGIFKIEEKQNGDILWNGFPVEKARGNKLEINEKIYDITPGIRKVITDTTNIPMQKLNEQDNETFINILESVNFEIYKAVRGESKSGRYKQSKSNFKKRNLEGQGNESIIPSNIFDIYTRLEVLLGLKLSSHTDTLTEASNLIDKLYKRGEKQNEQQYRNARNKISTI